jgi:RNA polymerase sigma factor (sigma-70 family)
MYPMVNARRSLILSRVGRLVAAKAFDDLTDRELLDRFVSQEDHWAFEKLVRRHGPMVLRVANRVLSNVEDAEDILQATFLTLARRASSIRRRDSAGSWLHGVAYRLALKSRADAAKRHSREKARPTSHLGNPLSEMSGKEICEILDEELNRLPETNREALVLCLLEGRTRDEAAKQLGLTVGTLKRRLEQGRNVLHARLRRRGIELSAVLGTATFAEAIASAGLSIGAVRASVQAAALVSTGKLVPGIISARAVALSEGVVTAMFVSKIKSVGLVLLALTLTGGALGAILLPGLDAGPAVRAGLPAAAESRRKDNRNLPAQGGAEPMSGQKKASANVAWGKPEDGLQVGICLTTNGPIRIGEPLTFELRVRNVSKKRVELQLRATSEWKANILAGKVIWIIASGPGPGQEVPLALDPSEEKVVPGPNPTFRTRGLVPAYTESTLSHPCGYHLKVADR